MITVDSTETAVSAGGDAQEYKIDGKESEQSLVEWLRIRFKLDEARLPGDVKCHLARQALDRHKQVRRAKNTVLRWKGGLPDGESGPHDPSVSRVGVMTTPMFPDAPSHLKARGLEVQQDDLQEAFGFKRSLWYDMHHQWDPKTKAGLKGAKTFQQWARDPDAVIPGTKPPKALYYTLNKLPFHDLNKTIEQDRRGELCLSEPEDDEEDDEDDEDAEFFGVD